MLSVASALAVGLSVAAFAAGLVSAYLWLKSARVSAIPIYIKLGQIEPLDAVQTQTQWTLAILEAGQEVAKLNAQAAVSSAVTILLSGVASFLGMIG